MRKLSVAEIEALTRVYNHGPSAWLGGRSNTGGSIKRLFGRLKQLGLVVGPPYEVTSKGRLALKGEGRGLKG